MIDVKSHDYNVMNGVSYSFPLFFAVSLYALISLQEKVSPKSLFVIASRRYAQIVFT